MMTEQQIKQLVTDYYECEFGISELIKRTEDVVLCNVSKWIASHNLKRENGDYLLHIADNDVVITPCYTRKLCNELQKKDDNADV